MKPVQSILRVLNSPFSGNSNPKKEMVSLFWMGVFVTGFLYFFKPFNLDRYQGNLLLLTIYFGLATWLGGMLYSLVTTYIFGWRQDSPNWVLWKWILCSMGTIAVITCCNLLVLWIVFEGQLNLTMGIFLGMLANTLGIGVFPITFSGLIKYYRNESRFQQEAASISLEPHKVVSSGPVINIPSDYSDSFSCAADRILALESQDNYVAVRHQSNGQLESVMVRNSLSAISQVLPGSNFFRCHRSFIVNLNQVQEISGNAQGLVLTLPGALKVPVSRTYIKPLRERIQY